MTTDAPALETPRQRSRLTRHAGEVALVQRLPTPAVALFSEGIFKWFSATPELVEQAWALGSARVEVLAVQMSGGPETTPGATLTGRLVRVDLASDAEAPNPATRTRDLLRDWNEVLHRLAQ